MANLDFHVTYEKHLCTCISIIKGGNKNDNREFGSSVSVCSFDDQYTYIYILNQALSSVRRKWVSISQST